MDSSGRGGARGGSRPQRGRSQNIAAFGDAPPSRRQLRDEANSAVRGAYRKKAPRLQNIGSFGDSLASGDAIPDSKPVS